MVNEMQERPLLIYQKNADKTLNKVVIPKAFVEKHGYEFSMEVYKDKIILRPIKEGE